MGGGDQLDAAFGDSTRGGGLLGSAHLVNDDHLGHVVFHRLDHHAVLLGGRRHLHAPGMADGRVRNIAVAGDFVGGIDDDHALARFVGEDAGNLAQHGGLADAGASQQEDVLAAVGQILDYLDGAEYGAPNAAGDAHHVSPAVTDGRDAVQGPLHAGAIVVAEIPDAGDDVLQVFPTDRVVSQHHVAVGEAGLGQSAQIEDNF